MARKLFLVASIVLLSAVAAQAARFSVNSVNIRLYKGTTLANATTLTDTTGGTAVSANASATAAGGGITVAYNGAPPASFTTAGQTASLSIKAGTGLGTKTGTLDVGSAAKAKLLGTASAKEAASLGYTVAILEQRKIKGSTVNIGNVMKGSKISTTIGVTSIDNSPKNATSVYVAQGGQTDPVSGLTFNQTLVNTTGKVLVPVTGRLTAGYNTNPAGKAILISTTSGTVTSAEASSVNDPGGYTAATFKIKGNVGVAKISTNKTVAFKGATVLTAGNIAVGEQIASYKGVNFKSTNSSDTFAISGKVKEAGTLAADTTAAAGLGQVTFNAKTGAPIWGSNTLKAKLFGVVGTEATIVASTPVTTAGDVTMQFRKRFASESYTKGAILPLKDRDSISNTAKWLTSDVVQIGGTAMTADVTYALQMTFDNRINRSFDGSAGTPAAEFGDSYIAKLNSSNVWERTVIGAGHHESLADFLSENAGKTLDQLEGQWGVDPSISTSSTERGTSWAILKGAGTFAVVPEPATVLMILSATIGAMAYGWRRWSRKSRLPA